MSNDRMAKKELKVSGGFTVLMAVYHRDDPGLFQKALESVFTNTLNPQNVLIVADGPLNRSLDAVLAGYEARENCLSVLRLPVNAGLANALNEGLKYVKTEWVARADSDDINYPDRFAKQALALLVSNEKLDLMGSAIREVDEHGSQLAIRRTVSGSDAIRTFAAKRNPFNHMTVWYRTSLARQVGGYPEIYLKEDYGLWALMLVAGARCDNIFDVTVDAVTGDKMYARRGGLKYALAEIGLQKLLHRCSIKSKYQSLVDGVLRAFVFLLPSSIRSILYKLALRADVHP